MKLMVSTVPILSVIGRAGVDRPGSAPSTLESKRTVISRAMTPLGLPVATLRRAAVAGDLAEELIERHRRIGERPPCRSDQQRQDDGDAQVAGVGGAEA